MNLFKKKLVAAALATLCAAPAWSATLSFNPSSADFIAGSGIAVDLVISNLAVGKSLGAFDLNINFDGTVLDFFSYTLGSQLGSLAASESFDASAGLVASGKVNLGQVSFLWDLSGQPRSFTLASLNFIGKNVGTTTLSFSDVTLSDDWGNPLAFSNLGSSALSVTPVPESESYAMLLAGLGLMGLVARRRSRFH